MSLKKSLSLFVRCCHTNSSSETWKSVIGLEIHAQLSAKSKLFSSSGYAFGTPVNSDVSLLDAAIPGTLPVLNRKCVELAVISSLALGCKINPVSYFDRKHYFYSDLPVGYQITQQRVPIATNGIVNFIVCPPERHLKPYLKSSKIKQIQLEQDSGKSLHDNKLNTTFIDLNRAGVPLIEIVFEPDIADGEEAAGVVHELKIILRRIGSCSCRMGDGALRVDANVSLHKEGTPLGVRTEIKNISSTRGVANAINYEIQRQLKIINNGGIVINETRTWDAAEKKTIHMRDKEETQDYRFMPEPNLPPLRLLIDEKSWGNHGSCENSDHIFDLRHLKNQLPPLPDYDRNLLLGYYGITLRTSYLLLSDSIMLNYFYQIMKEKPTRDPNIAANFFIDDLPSLLGEYKIKKEECCLSMQAMGEAIDLLQERKISDVMCRTILKDIIFGCSKSPLELVNERNLSLITDPVKIREICNSVLDNQHSTLIKKAARGKKRPFGALLTNVCEVTNNQADMPLVVKIMTQLLKDRTSNQNE